MTEYSLTIIILKVNCNDILIVFFLLLQIMRVRAAQKGPNQGPVIERAAHAENKYIVPTPKGCNLI